MKPRTIELRRNSGSARAGITLIELMVAMTGLLVIGGIVLQIYDETQKAAQKMVRRQAGVDFAVAFLDQASDLLRQAVPPSSLDVPIATVFLPDRFSVPVYGDPASNGLFLLSLRPREDAADGRRFETVREVWAAADNSTRGTSTQEPFGAALQEALPKVSFRYATESRPGGAPPYRDQLEPAEWPVLVEVKIEVPGDEGEEPVVMQTAVIPGRLGPIQPFAPSPTPTPVASAPLAVQEVAPAAGAAAPAPAAPVPAAPAAETAAAPAPPTETAPAAVAPAPAAPAPVATPTPAPRQRIRGANPLRPAAVAPAPPAEVPPAQPAATETQL